MLIFGIILLIIEIIFIFYISKMIRRFLVCTKVVEARVVSISEDYTESEDSETGNKTRTYYYTVFFSYNFNGKSYEAEHSYTDSCSFSQNQITKIKINPNNPEKSEDCWTSGDLFELIKSLIGIAFWGFFSILIIYMALSQH